MWPRAGWKRTIESENHVRPNRPKWARVLNENMVWRKAKGSALVPVEVETEYFRSSLSKMKREKGSRIAAAFFALEYCQSWGAPKEVKEAIVKWIQGEGYEG